MCVAINRHSAAAVFQTDQSCQSIVMSNLLLSFPRLTSPAWNRLPCEMLMRIPFYAALIIETVRKSLDSGQPIETSTDGMESAILGAGDLVDELLGR